MQKPIIPGDIWRHTGKHCGHGEVHKVLMTEPHEIITSSGKHSWLGPEVLFRSQFEPLPDQVFPQ